MCSGGTCSLLQENLRGAEAANEGQGLGLPGAKEEHSWTGAGRVASGRVGSKLVLQSSRHLRVQ